MLTTMNLRRWRVAALAAAAGLLALATLTSAHAQFLPAVFYGNHLRSGATVEAFIGGNSCGSTKVTASGEWVLQIAGDAPCKPTTGAVLSFAVDGKAATSSPNATWESGGIPTGHIANGYVLSVPGETVTPGPGSEGSSSTSKDSGGGGGSNVIVFAGIGLLLVAAVGGGLFFMRRKAT